MVTFERQKNKLKELDIVISSISKLKRAMVE